MADTATVASLDWVVRKALTSIHECLKGCTKTNDQLLIDGAQVYGLERRGGGPLSAADALEMKAHLMDSKASDRLDLKTIEQNTFLNTLGIFQRVLDAPANLAKTIETFGLLQEQHGPHDPESRGV